MTIRKNFNFNENMVKELELTAIDEDRTQTEIMRDALKMYLKAKNKRKRLEALDRLAGSLTGKIGDIDLKEARLTYLLEKHGY